MSNVFEYAYEHNKKVISIDGDESRKVVRREGKLYVDFEDCLIRADNLDGKCWRVV